MQAGRKQEADVEMHRELERGRDEIDTARRRIDRAAPAEQHGESVQAAVQILMQRRDERGGPTTFSSWSRRTGRSKMRVN